MDEDSLGFYYVRTVKITAARSFFGTGSAAILGRTPASFEGTILLVHSYPAGAHQRASQSLALRSRSRPNAICSILPIATQPCLVEPRVPVCATMHIARPAFYPDQRRWSEDFKIMSAPWGARPTVLDRGGPHRRGCMIIKVAVYRIISCASSAKQPAANHDPAFASGEEHAIRFHEKQFARPRRSRI